MSRAAQAAPDRTQLARRVVADFAMTTLAVAVAYLLRFHVYPAWYIPGGTPPDLGHYLRAAPVVGLTAVSVFWLTGTYRQRRGIPFIDELFALIGSTAVALLVVLALIGLYRDFPYARLPALYWAVVAVAMVSLARHAIRRYEAGLRARGIGVERALLVGWGAAADLLVQRLRMFPEYGYQVVGVLADELEPGTEVADARVLGGIGDITRVLHAGPVDTVFFAQSDLTTEHLVHLIDCCRRRGVDVRILPGVLELMTTAVTGDQVDGIPLLQLRHGLDVRGPKTVAKRAFDVAVAGAGLVVASPFLALIALLVKVTSPGPVLIHQERVGMQGTPFRTHKFRSMRVDAEARTGPVWAGRHDERRTGVGRVLRRLSLDELPQLWNIVRGEMSLVGPRPERPTFVKEFSTRLPRYCDRQLVRPGLAGWAQANDLRGQTPVEERLIYDLYYIENWSLAFDIKILLITLARVWTHKNAY